MKKLCSGSCPAWLHAAGAALSPYKKSVLALAFVVMLAFVWQKAPPMLDRPNAQDTMGYFVQARLFQTRGFSGGLRSAHLDNSAFESLRETGLEIGSTSPYWGIAPATYRYNARTDQFVLPYPPGTGFFFSLFAEGARNEAATLWASLGLLAWSAALLFVGRLRGLAVAFGVGVPFALVLFLLASADPLAGAVGAGLLPLWAGLVGFIGTDKKRGRHWLGAIGACGFVCGAMVDVALVNGGLALGSVFWLVARRDKKTAMRAGAAFASGLLISLLPFIVTQAGQTGAPLLAWPAVVQSVASFAEDPGILALLALTALGMATLARAARREASAAAVVLFGSVLTMAAFAPAKAADLFPALAGAALFLSMGAALAKAEPQKLRRASLLGGAASLLFLLGVTFLPARSPVEPSLAAQAAAWQGGVVWADESGSRLLYAYGVPALKLAPLPLEIRQRVIEKVQARGQDQYFVVDSALMANFLLAVKDRYPLQLMENAFESPVLKLVGAHSGLSE